MTARYDSGDVSPEPLGRPIYFPNSGRTVKNRLSKSPMIELLASWSPKNASERGIPTDELVELYKQ